ncbi:hypothetical protein [Nocardia transvalensis]|uniref:hypothetical protein n=1 Tax=Nocardia transvalensis TaxID=37333 RepID=UPI0018937C10|nr:hypothetical protein [Nocardia transvalensis]MBF6332982.1 hypothetical protein [Nocardia transvalensis]
MTRTPDPDTISTTATVPLAGPALRSRYRARAVTGMLALAAGALMPVGITTTAHADPIELAPLLACVGDEHTEYKPPLTNQPQDVKVSTEANYGPCGSTHPQITSGTGGFKNQQLANRSCSDLLNPTPSEFTIKWNTGEESRFVGQRMSNTVGGVFVVTVTGQVVDGPFQDEPFVKTLQAAATDITLCTVGQGEVKRIDSTIDLVIG